MLQEERNKWRGYIRKIGMIGLVMLLMLPPMLMNPASHVFADEGDYEFLENGETITITGYLGSDADLIIPERIQGKVVTAIGDTVFMMRNLNTVIIPETVTTIGGGAFMGSGLQSVTLNEGLVEIGSMAFAGNSFEHIDIPSTVTTIGAGALSQGNLRTVALHEGLETIGDSAFWNNELTSVTIPDGVTTIGESAFIDNLLEEVTLPGTITSMGKQAFLGEAGKNNIRTLILQEGLSSIGESAFKDNLLESVHIPGSVSFIEKEAFMGNEITTIILDEGVREIGEHAFEQNKIEEIVIPDTVNLIAMKAFYQNEISTLTLPDSVEVVEAAAFGFNPLTEVKVYNDEVVFEEVLGLLPFFRYPSGPSASITLFGRSGSTTESYALAASAFGYTFQLLSVCGDDIVFECDVNDDGTLTITGYDGNAPKHVMIPETIEGRTVTAIGDVAFSNLNLTGIELPNSLTSIGSSSFYWNSITTVTIPSGVTSIENLAFANNQLEHVSIPDSVTAIEDFAFHKNLLTEVIIPNGVDYVGLGAFSNNPLTTIRFEGTPTSIDSRAFDPDTAVYSDFKGWYTDENFENEWDNTVPEPMTIYGKWEYTVSFETGGGTTVDSQLIYHNGTITMPDAPSKAGEIFDGWYVDEEHTTLWNFDHEVTENMTLYAKWVPYVCGYGTDFNCRDNHDGTITITGYAGTSKDVEIPEMLDGKRVTVIDGGTHAALGAFANMDLESVSIPNSVISIGGYAFYQNKLEAIHIPASVKRIGDHAFDDNNLAAVTLSEGLERIGTNAFARNNITGLIIPDTVTQIDYGAFILNQIDELTLGESLQAIANFAFASNQLETVTIPESVTSIGEGAFMNNQLAEFTVLGVSTAIDRNAFSQFTMPNPEELTIRSSCGSTANELANRLGHSFEPLDGDECIIFTLTPSITETTNEDVTVNIDVLSDVANVVELKWANGNKDLVDFHDGDGDDVTDNQFTVSENGTYTVYVKDRSGNEKVERITISNIDKSLLIIHVQIVDGETITLHTYGSDSIQQLKQKIQDAEGITPDNQQIIFGETVLEDGRTLADYSIPNRTTLQLIILSSDASLRQLGVALNGERAFELDPTHFDHDIGNTEQETIEIFATTNDSNARITLNGVSFDNTQTLQLNEGENTFTMIVTAENGHEQTYTIIVNRQVKAPSPGGGGGVYIPSSNASLDRFEAIIDGENRLPFDRAQFAYDLGDTEAETVEIIVNAHHPKAKITLDGEAFADKKILLLNEGENSFNIAIVAENGDKKNYTIIVNRLEKVPFTDIAEHWAESDIKKTYWEKTFYGYPDQTFRPDAPISRMEVTSVFVRLLELDEQKQVPFTDVQPLGKEVMVELEKAYANGVVKGYPDQTFKPFADVTRAHLALMFYRTYEKVNGTPYEPKQLAYFPDTAGYNQETQNAIAMLVELKIAEGSDGEFRPDDQATRAQAAKMFVRFKEVLGRLENK